MVIDMDINDIRVLVTVVSFLTFVGIVWWAYSARRAASFDRAARSVLEEADDDMAQAAQGRRR
jgi:cytochrome c oxidase cbb3-type subunit 4